MPRVLYFLPLPLLCALVLVGCGKKDADSDTSSSGGGGSGGGDSRPSLGVPNEETKKETARRLKDIGIALHTCHDANGYFPAGFVAPKGQLGLSWRVAILPYIEEVNLFHEFKLDEPWDSEHNKKLIPKMPKVFEMPNALSSNGKTFFRSFAGPNAFIQTPPMGPKGPMYPPLWADQKPGALARGRSIASITDGTSNTLMLAEATDPVEWTRPDELLFPDQPSTPEKSRSPLPKLGGIFLGGFYGVLCDGSVRFFPASTPAPDLRRLILVDDGEVFTMPGTGVPFPREKHTNPDDDDLIPPATPGTKK